MDLGNLSLKTDLKRAALSVGPLATSLLLMFQNCGEVQFATDVPSDQEYLSSALLTINNGAEFTNDTGVKVQVQAPASAASMYLTNDPNCEGDGKWEPLKLEAPWTLARSNDTALVYAKFRTSINVELPCISASIIHDNLAPTITITDAPPAYSNQNNTRLLMSAFDSLSGVDYFECKNDAGTFTRCSGNVALENLAEGNQTFQARAVDRAGNRSDVAEHFWVVDLTPPAFSITEAPEALITQSFATIRFASDDSGSGLAAYYCSHNQSNPYQCGQTETLQGLLDGVHTFTAWSVDRAGNESEKKITTWTVDTIPSSDFLVIGVVGGTDTNPDTLLGTTLTPAVKWVTSSGAVRYRISILDTSGSTVVCPARETTQTTYAYSSADCTLVNGQAYQARIVAFDSSNLQKAAPDFSFKVDNSPPTIVIDGPVSSQDQTEATFNFAITDSSGVNNATCSKTYEATQHTFNCKDLTTYTFTELADGMHTFKITATDNAGNTGSSAPISWNVLLIICDPFSQVEGGCMSGLKGSLYYLTAEQPRYTLVDDYINYGVKADALVYMSQLFVPTRSYTSGFSTTDGTMVKNDQGEPLYEYFALDFETIIKLAPENQAGYYQFSLLSDDGAILDIRSSPSAPFQTVVNNDNQHPTRLGCAPASVYLDQNTRLLARVKYFQGPRERIALSLLMKKMPDSSAPPADASCGKVGTELFFGPDMANPDFVHYEYGTMVANGWQPLSADNFILSEEAQ